MVVCPNCNHENPTEATLCETCYTPLPLDSQCPNCGSAILSTATFCGQCGFNLPEKDNMIQEIQETMVEVSTDQSIEDEQEEETFVVSGFQALDNETSELEEDIYEEDQLELESNFEKFDLQMDTPTNSIPDEDRETVVYEPSLKPPIAKTQLQTPKASLYHVQTDQTIELPENLSLIHIGKENEQVPPDIDVSGFPDSQFVSRIHADIRVEADAFYLEDVGSANGTYINHIPLPKGNRHRLRPGDRIALGKEDKVSFIFQIPSK